MSKTLKIGYGLQIFGAIGLLLFGVITLIWHVWPLWESLVIIVWAVAVLIAAFIIGLYQLKG